MCEASRGSQAKAIRHLEWALEELDGLPQPFDRAVTEADLGGVLRRAGRGRAAVTRLERAAATLARLAAVPYLHRVERELSACGLHPGRDRTDARERLTPAEHSLARLVAQGKTNREVAAELIISVKTVEHHLARIYQKLGVTSRTQLAVQFDPEA